MRYTKTELCEHKNQVEESQGEKHKLVGLEKNFSVVYAVRILDANKLEEGGS